MDSQWHQRRTILRTILKISNQVDEAEEGKALDVCGHPPNVDHIRCGDHDFSVIGTLASGQFGVVSQ